MKSEIRRWSKVNGWKFLVLCCLLSTTISHAQTVPSDMKIGDLKLTITEGARKQIQKDVDRFNSE